MSILEIIFAVLLIVFSILVIGVVLLQEGRTAGLGVIQGGADSFLSKNKARTLDAFLSRSTKFVAIVFFVLTIIANFVIAWVK